MTGRNPFRPGETQIDRMLRDAQARGEFDDLPGAGKPIVGLDGPHDELWWVKQLMEREKLSWTPPTLALRKEVERVLDRVAEERSETRVREMLTELNARIRRTNSHATSGPATSLMPLDIEAVVGRWRDSQGPGPS